MFILKSHSSKSLSIDYNPKYLLSNEDNFYINNEDYIIASEGCYLSSVTPTIEDIINLDYDSFSSKYKGSYAVCYYDKKTNLLKLYNDRLSKKFIFYYSDNAYSIISTSFLDLIDFLKDKNVKLSINVNAQECFFEYGCFEDNHTYVNEVKCLYSYQYIELSDKLCIKSIALPSFDENEFKDLSSIVDKVHELFVQAMARIIEKNKKLNKSTLVSLSGGMDSRIAFFEAYNQMGNSFNSYCYAQSNSKDHSISAQIAADYNVKYHFYPLDGGEFILQRAELMEKNDAQMYYCGATGMYKCIKGVKDSHTGIIVLGINGGEIFGDVLKPDDENQPDEFNNLAIRKNLDEIRCCENSTYTVADIAETAAPFLDEDFFEYLMSVPYKYKAKRLLYIELFKKYYNISHETTTFKTKIGKRKNYFAGLLNHLQEIILKKGKYSMNPFEYWWKNNKDISSYVNDGFNSDIEFLKNIGLSTDYIVKEFNKAFLVKKLQIFSYTGALVRIYKKEE